MKMFYLSHPYTGDEENLDGLVEQGGSGMTLHEIIASHERWLNQDGGGKRADLSGADLSGADLSGADLRWADLSGADLCCADLRGANLRWADLRGADLCGADLRDAIMFRADLRDAIMNEKIVQVGPIGSRGSHTIYFVDQDIVQCGCWNEYRGGSLEQFKSRIDEVYPDGKYRQEYLAAIELFERLKNYRKTEKLLHGGKNQNEV